MALRQKVRQFYLKHNPGNLKNLDQILEKYNGQEEKLFALLERKYGMGATTKPMDGAGASSAAHPEATLDWSTLATNKGLAI
jgi:hypothetical protein